MAPSFSTWFRMYGLRLLCLRIKSTLHPNNFSRNNCALQTSFIVAGNSTKISTSLSSRCSPRATEPKIRIYDVPNRVCSSAACVRSKSIYSCVLFILVSCFRLQRYNDFWRNANKNYGSLPYTCNYQITHLEYLSIHSDSISASSCVKSDNFSAPLSTNPARCLIIVRGVRLRMVAIS